MRIIILILLFSFSGSCFANDSSLHFIKINFLYGSKPAKGYKQTESKHFGGLKGGHVNIEAGGVVLDFMPGKNPLFPRNKKPTGGFRLNHSIYWDTSNTKWTTIIVPVSTAQFSEIVFLFDSLSKKSPYDYAVFGMRCAAASYDVLSRINLLPSLNRKKNIAAHFYPKLLRKKILRWATENNFSVLNHEGRSSRKWESDKGFL